MHVDFLIRPDTCRVLFKRTWFFGGVISISIGERSGCGCVELAHPALLRGTASHRAEARARIAQRRVRE